MNQIHPNEVKDTYYNINVGAWLLNRVKKLVQNSNDRQNHLKISGWLNSFRRQLSKIPDYAQERAHPHETQPGRKFFFRNQVTNPNRESNPNRVVQS